MYWIVILLSMNVKYDTIRTSTDQSNGGNPMLYHDSHSARYRSPLGAIKAGDQLTIRFWCDESDTVILRTWDGQEQQYPMTAIGDDHFEATVTVPETPMLFWYDFIIPKTFSHNKPLRF